MIHLTINYSTLDEHSEYCQETGIPIALWELCGKRLCLGFVVELLNCGTLCTEVDEEFRESFGGEPLQ